MDQGPGTEDGKLRVVKALEQGLRPSSGASVRFEPGRCRLPHPSARPDPDRHHRHSGAQREGGPIEEIRPGDVVWLAPNEKHWHGAVPFTAMTHIAIQEALDGKAVDWDGADQRRTIREVMEHSLAVCAVSGLGAR